MIAWNVRSRLLDRRRHACARLESCQCFASGGVVWVERQCLLQTPDPFCVGLDHAAHPEPGLLIVWVGLQYLIQKLPRFGLATGAGGGSGLLE